MKYKNQVFVMLSLMVIIVLTQCTKFDHEHPEQPGLANDGKEIFRHDTFGDEDFWSGLLHLDKAIAGQNNGGFGPGVSPNTALAVGLKVDADALPAEVVAADKIQNH
jgi:hypothetical protein